MKKFLAVLLAALMVLTVFAACSKEPAGEETTAEVVENPGDDETAPADGDEKVLIMGSSCDFPPYEYVDDNGDYAGIDVDIAKLVCEKLGYTLQIENMTFNSILAAVEAKTVDFGMSGFTVTEERQQQVNFTTSYEKAFQAILVKAGSDIKGKEDLEGKKIGVQLGTTGDSFTTEDFGEDAVNRYEKYSQAVTALQNDQVDVVVLDIAPAQAFAEANEDLTVLEATYGQEDYAIAFNKENTELLDQFNSVIDELLADGTIDEILAKYKSEDAE